MYEILDYATAYPDNFAKIRAEIAPSYPFTINQIQKWQEKYPTIPITDLINQISLQKKAIEKFPFAERWFFTDKNYQQASTFHLARYHGSLFADFEDVADLCCGIGADLLFLSKNKRLCYAVDSDDTILAMCKWNMSYFQRTHITYLHSKAELFSHTCEAVFVDPDRRKASRRYTDTENISPSFSAIKKFENIAVKLSPMLDFEQKKYEDYSCDLVSVNGMLKECLLRGGKLKGQKRAVLLPQNTIFTEKGHPQTHISPVSKWILEPDPAIIRGHMVNDLAFEQGLYRIDPHSALLTSNTTPDTTYGSKYPVADTFDYNLKSLQRYLKAKDIGILDIKTRGFSEPVEVFRKSLKLSGKNKATLFIVKIGAKHRCIFSY